jgi:hypothetical protein
MNRAIRTWRTQFRGKPRVKDDTQITDEDIASANLVLWGDFESNAVIKRIFQEFRVPEIFPLPWDQKEIKIGEQKFSSADHVPILIYPNPLNQTKYIVLNSGFTFREADFHSSNARQIPRLPDWAIIDLRTPPDAERPGKIVAAGFFGEGWEVKSETEKPAEPKMAVVGKVPGSLTRWRRSAD